MDVLIHFILPFFGVFLALIVVHEGGHYVTAKMFGVKVLEAGVGLPPRIWGFRWRDTDYTINALPIGAFVRMLGEEDPSDPRSLAAQPKWKRTIIIGAGAAMNFVLAVVLFSVGLMVPREVSEGGVRIVDIAPNSPAATATLRDNGRALDDRGLKPGDQVIEVDGRHVASLEDATYFIQLERGNHFDLTIKRPDPREGPKVLTASVYGRWDPPSYTDECGVERRQGPTGIQIAPSHTHPVPLTESDRTRREADARKLFAEYKKGIAPDAPSYCAGGGEFGFVPLTAAQCADLEPDERAKAEALKGELFAAANAPCYRFDAGPVPEAFRKTRSEPFWEALPHGLRMSFESLILTRNQIWIVVRQFDSSQGAVFGPVGIAQVTGEVVKAAGWISLIEFAAQLSMSLAIFNVLPIPMVDGGRLVFILIEFLRGGRRIAPQKEALVHLVGLAAIIAFAAVLTYFDLARIFEGNSIIR